MSNLTKILVVLLVVLAIAHSAMLLAYLSQQQSWKTRALGYNDQINHERALRISDNLANTQTMDQIRKEKLDLQRQLGAAETLLDQANTDLTDLRLQHGRLNIENDTFRQQLTNLNNLLTLAQKASLLATEHLDRARNTAYQLKAENAQLETQVAYLMKDLRVRNDEVRAQKQKIIALQDEIRQASGRTTVRAPVVVSVQPRPVAARRPINGKVVGVDLDAKIATVNIGSIAGVAEGTKFTIFDDNRNLPYVGDLMITRVSRDRALGTILGSAKPVVIGNHVSTDPLK